VSLATHKSKLTCVIIDFQIKNQWLFQKSFPRLAIKQFPLAPPGNPGDPFFASFILSMDKRERERERGQRRLLIGQESLSLSLE
jgi:hypothetical protein